MELKEKLKELRLEHERTQKDVAQGLGIIVQTYQKYESGQRNPKLKTLMKIAEYYNISINELIEEQ